MDEVFGEENFVGEFIWKNKHGGGGDSPHNVKENEFILFFCKKLSRLPELFAIPPVEYENMFREEDESGKFYFGRLDKKGIDSNRPNLIYPIECPDGTFKDGEQKLNFIVETKDVNNKDGLRNEEKFKIKHAEKFFDGTVKIEFRTQFSNNKIVDLIK